jgi:hypothetical protein
VADDITTADDLYGLDPSEFVTARDALAKRLRSDGKREEAARIAKLRRPPAAAWALNQVARTQPDLVMAALQAGRALRDATEAALAGDPSGLRAATGVERAAGDEVIAAAAVHLGDAAPATQQRLSGTLRAAVVDDDVADALRQGVLTTDHEAPAFGFAAGLDVVAAPSPTRAPRSTGRTRRAPSDRSADTAAEAEEDRQAREAAKEEAAAQRRQATEHRRELARLERTAERAEREAATAEASAVEARRNADAARQALEEARGRFG